MGFTITGKHDEGSDDLLPYLVVTECLEKAGHHRSVTPLFEGKSMTLQEYINKHPPCQNDFYAGNHTLDEPVKFMGHGGFEVFSTKEEAEKSLHEK